MSGERLDALLEARAPGAWELYEKRGESLTLSASPTARRRACRREEGWAARWWDPASRFAAASSPTDLARAIAGAREVRTPPGEPPDLPAGRSGARQDPPAVPEPPDLFEELARLLSAESRGEAVLSELELRRAASLERVSNARGLDVSWSATRFDGRAAAVGRRGARACEARALFRWEAEPDLPTLARRLCDRATLPLSDRTTPIERGEWLLDPSVAAALLAALSPLFLADGHATWASRGQLFPAAVRAVDDATGDAPYDGEGTRSRRVAVIEGGALAARLHDLASARRAGAAPTGHGVRHSYRTPPARAPRRLFFAPESGVPPRRLLASVRRGLFASALTAPFQCDLEHDRFEAEFTGVSVVAGRASGPVGAARARGRLSEMLRRVAALSTDRQFFAMPGLVGAPTLLVERVAFE